MNEELESRRKAIATDAKAVPDETILSQDLSSLAEDIASKYAFELPQFHF